MGEKDIFDGESIYVLAMGQRHTKIVKEFYDKTAERYDEEYQTPYWQLYHEITWRNIKKFLPKRRNAVILDAGGGTGFWTGKLAKLGYRVLLTDISRNMLKVAKEKVRREKLEGEIETAMVDIRDMSCFPSDYFDMVLAEGDPVSYCLDPERAVRELARVAKPNAHVVVSVDSKYPRVSGLIAEGSFAKMRNFLRTGILKGEFRFQAFTPQELRTLFETCGLKVIRIVGKPVLVQMIPREARDEAIRKNFGEILELELKFCDNPNLVGIAGHLEIVGVKSK